MGGWGDIAAGAGGGAASGAAFGPWGALIGAGIGATASMFGAKEQSNAQEHAADIQSKAAADTLTFERQQAGVNQANFQTAQNANYGQWLYRQGIARPYQGTGLAANNTLAQLLGLPAQSTTLPDLPPAPQFTTGGAPGATTQPSTPSGQPSASSGMPSGIDPRFAAVYQKYGVTPGGLGSGPLDWHYYQNDAVTNAKGDVDYVLGRLDKDLANRNTPQAASGSQGKTLATYAGMPQAPTPAGTASPLPFLPLNSLGGAYLMPSYGVV